MKTCKNELERVNVYNYRYFIPIYYAFPGKSSHGFGFLKNEEYVLSICIVTNH